ncbi:MAG: metal ABC transporter ATP-binding protein, partial [Mycobacteriaceae bacterium]
QLNLSVYAGEFVAVLGPNGSGKTSLLKVLLGEHHLTSGTASISGAPVSRRSSHVGYIPQQRSIERGVTLRGRDLISLGIDGHTWGPGLKNRINRKKLVDSAIKQVDAQSFANAPLGSLSGGQQQRLRIAQALAGNPQVLLCDEPLLSLDLASQRLVSELIDRRRRDHGTAVIFVTHEINPILPFVDQVLYLVDGRFKIGKPEQVITSEVLSDLYKTKVDVLQLHNQLLIVGSGDAADALNSSGIRPCEGMHHLESDR